MNRILSIVDELWDLLGSLDTPRFKGKKCLIGKCFSIVFLREDRGNFVQSCDDLEVFYLWGVNDVFRVRFPAEMAGACFLSSCRVLTKFPTARVHK